MNTVKLSLLYVSELVKAELFALNGSTFTKVHIKTEPTYGGRRAGEVVNGTPLTLLPSDSALFYSQSYTV